MRQATFLLVGVVVGFLLGVGVFEFANRNRLNEAREAEVKVVKREVLQADIAGLIGAMSEFLVAGGIEAEPSARGVADGLREAIRRMKSGDWPDTTLYWKTRCRVCEKLLVFDEGVWGDYCKLIDAYDSRARRDGIRAAADAANR